MSEIHIKVDGQEKSWPDASITPKDILKLGEKNEPYSNYTIYKNQSEKIWAGEKEGLNEAINIKDGDKLQITPNGEGEIYYTVNGEEQEPLSTGNNKLTVSQILQAAKFTPVEKFRLFNVKEETSYSDPNEEIVVDDGDEFLALASGPTPVAI